MSSRSSCLYPALVCAPSTGRVKRGSVWAAASVSEQGKGVITTQEEPEVREHIRAGPGSYGVPAFALPDLD
jgi:hypothetical protein